MQTPLFDEHIDDDKIECGKLICTCELIGLLKISDKLVGMV
jgi:hypothetical protein